MKFNIKNWQDKHLLTELEFRNQKAFQRYDAENKIRPSTKITVGGKATTAGEQGGGTPDRKQSARKTAFSMKRGAIDGSTFEKMVPELKQGKSYDFREAEVEFLQTALKSAGVHGKDNVSLKDAEKAVDNISPDSMQAFTDKHYPGESRVKSFKGTPDEIKQRMKHDLKNLFDPEHRINKEFQAGAGSIKVSWATGERVPGWATDPNGGRHSVGAETLPGYDPSHDSMSRKDAQRARIAAVGGMDKYLKQSSKLKHKDGKLVSKGGNKKGKAFSMKKGSIDGNTFAKMPLELKRYKTRVSDYGRIDLMASTLKSAGVYDKDNVTLKDAIKAVDNMPLDDIQAYHDKYKITSETPDVAKTEMKDDLKKLFDPEWHLNKAFRAGGGSIKVSYATGERIPRWATDPNGGEYAVGSETLPGYDPSHDSMSRKDAENARVDAVGGGEEYDKLTDKLKHKDGKLVSKGGDTEMSDDDRVDNMTAGEIWLQDPDEPYEYDTSTAEKAGFKFTGGNVDGFNGKDNYGEEGEAEIIDMADQVAKGKMKQSKMDKSLHPEDPRMSDQGRKKEYASQNYGESVTPRSTRIQEAKIYRTIQQLKGLEKK